MGSLTKQYFLWTRALSEGDLKLKENLMESIIHPILSELQFSKFLKILNQNK